jgi:hypothetical protein
MPPKEVTSQPKWNVEVSGNYVSIESDGTTARPICSIPLDQRPRVFEWIKDGRKLRVFSRDRYTDIEWDPPEAVEEPILDLVRLVIGKRFDENRKMVPIPDEERIKLRNEMPKWLGQVKDPSLAETAGLVE